MTDANKVLDLRKEDTAGSKSQPAAEATLGRLNTSNVLLPVPQYNSSETLKPIIEFLGEDTSEENATSESGKLSIPQDTHLILPKKDNFGSPIQDGVRPSMFANQNGISAALNLLSAEKDLNPGESSAVSDASKEKPLSVENHTALVESSVQRKLLPSSSLLAPIPRKGNFQGSHEPLVSDNAPPVQRLPSSPTHPLQSTTQSLLEGLLESKFGQSLGNTPLNSFASLQTPLNKNSIGNNQAKKPSDSSVQDGESPPPNKGLISNIISGLIHQPSSNSETKTSTASQSKESNNTTVQSPKSSSSDTLPWPTISIRENTISMEGLSDLFKDDYRAGSQNGVNELRGVFTKGRSEQRPSRKKHNEEKIRQLNEKIKRLETLSDALDALTSQLSTEDKRLDQNSNKDEDIAVNSNHENNHGRRHRKHHTHHPKSHPFEADFNILGPLLSSAEKYSKMDRKTPNYSKDKKDTTYIRTGIRKQNTFNSADVETLQRKINNAIEKAENTGHQGTPLLAAGQVDKDVGAQTRQEVTKIQSVNHTASKGNLAQLQQKSEIETLQEILKTLIWNALKKGTLNQLIQRWNQSGSPFVGIARNISSMLLGNGNMTKLNGGHAGKLSLSNTSLKNSQTTATKESLELSYEQALNQKTNTTSAQTQVKIKSQKTHDQESGVSNLTKDNLLFKKAVKGIITVLRKRYRLLGNTSISPLSLFSTDTLTHVKGTTLGGRINKDVSTTNRMPGLKANIVPQTSKGQTQIATSDTKDNTSKSLDLGVQNIAAAINITKQNDLPTLEINGTSQNDFTVINKTDQRTFSNNTTAEKKNSVNKTLMEFMESTEGTGGHMLNYKAPMVSLGYKDSKVKPRLRYLIAAVARTLMDLEQIKRQRTHKEPKIKYDVSGVGQLITTLPNDHTSGDFQSYADAILEAPNDHVEKSINSNRRMFNSTQSPSFTAQNNGTKLKTENNNLDSSETVTVTLERVNDQPTDLPRKLSPALDTSDTETSSRSTKIPHYMKVQSAVTLGKINRTSADNGENSVPLSQVHHLPVISTNTNESSQQIAAMPSDGNLNAISPMNDFRANRREEHQTKARPQLPLESQMAKIGRIAETVGKNDQPSKTLTSTSGIHELADTSSALAAKSGWVKIPDDKLLPMTSDSASAMTAKNRKTESIASKGGPLTTQATLAGSLTTPAKSELPTNLEVKEISMSVHALLKILSNYSHKLKMEEDKPPTSKGKDRAQNPSATIDNTKNFRDGKVGDEDKRIHIKFNGSDGDGQLNPLNSNHEEQTSLGTSHINFLNSRYATNSNSKGFGQTFDYSQTIPTLANYVDTGMFENIREQSDPEVNTYKWNRFAAPVQLHAQVPVDSNPTKNSFSPQQNADITHVNLGSSLVGVPEELKDENIPSIEDDPTVKAVQKIVADESVFESEKRKEILKHQKMADSQSRPHKSGVFGRNIILNKNNEKRPGNASRGGKPLKASDKNITNDTRVTVHVKQGNRNMRSRHTIPRAEITSVRRKNTLPHLKRKHLKEENYTILSTGHNPSIANYSRKMIAITKPSSKHMPGNTSQYISNRDKVPRGSLKKRQGTFHNFKVLKKGRNVASFVHTKKSSSHSNASLKGTSATGDMAKVHKLSQVSSTTAELLAKQQNATTNAKTDTVKLWTQQDR